MQGVPFQDLQLPQTHPIDQHQPQGGLATAPSAALLLCQILVTKDNTDMGSEADIRVVKARAKERGGQNQHWLLIICHYCLEHCLLGNLLQCTV